jgi:hypothetical protein
MSSRKINIWVLILISVLLLSAGVGSVYAYLSVTDSHTETFVTAGSEDPQVSVSASQTSAKATVSVPDAGYPVYVRAIVVVNWTNDGQICATPDGAEYEVKSDPGWIEKNGFYYYVNAIDSLNDEIEVTYTKVDGYDIKVQVICQTVQAVGTVDGSDVTAAFDAWGA